LVDVLLQDDVTPQGRNEIRWDGTDRAGRKLASGTYFCRINAGGYNETKRMTLIK
jgi:flagellar hook assembly protein FlgD